MTMYRAFIAQFNSAPTPINSTPNDNSATNGSSIPKSNSRLPDQGSSTELLLSYYKSIRQIWPPIVPPGWCQAGSWPVLGRVTFIFGQDMDGLRNGIPLDQLTGWTAQLDLGTRDIHSMMRDGLFLNRSLPFPP